MTKVNPYLTFNGNCLEAFNFYKSVFGGDFSFFGKFSQVPDQEGAPKVPEDKKDQIMHVSLPISKETVLMGSDTLEPFDENDLLKSNITISIQTDTKEKADKLFKDLSVGGSQTMPMSETFWGAYFGMITDKFGIKWMVDVQLRPM